MRREWATPLSILGGSVIVSLGLYFGLRPPPAVEVSAASDGAPTRPRSEDPRAAESPFTDRDRRRNIEDDETDPASAVAPPNVDGRRDDHIPSDEERANAIASPLPPDSQPESHAAQVEKDTTAAFEEIRSEIRDACWNSLPVEPGAPTSVSVDLSLSYDAEGKVIASGVSELREARRAGVAECVGPFVHGMRIPAPGANASVQVRVTIP